MATRKGSWDDRFPKYVPAAALKADGIASTKQRGAMADTWWSQRFIDVLEGYGLGARMQRGRRYARTGQVLSLDVRTGVLESPVQGSRRTPYDVRIAMRAQTTAAQWERVDAAIGAKVGFVARLLAGDVPPDLEEVFAEAGVDLFPLRWGALDASCSCPDFENPCKHIAAVLYVFADLLDRDPWLLLAWHGRTREQIVGLLGALGARTLADRSTTRVADDDVAPWWPLAPDLPLPVGGGGWIDAEPPTRPDEVLDALEDLRVVHKGEPVTSVLRRAYDALSSASAPQSDGAAGSAHVLAEISDLVADDQS